jgi:hypothetical protein
MVEVFRLLRGLSMPVDRIRFEFFGPRGELENV